jgi:hypothetical protein
MAVANRALDEAMALNHDLSIFCAIVHGVFPMALERGDREVTEQLVSSMLQRGEKFSPMRAWAQCYAGVLKIRKCDAASGLLLLRDGLKSDKGVFWSRYLFFLGDLAMGAFDAGDRSGALVTIDQALDQAERNEERWYAPELADQGRNAVATRRNRGGRLGRSSV